MTINKLGSSIILDNLLVGVQSMNVEKESNKPVPEQIIELMISDISKSEEFDNQLVEKLEGLYRSGELKKSARIIETIMPN